MSLVRRLSQIGVAATVVFCAPLAFSYRLSDGLHLIAYWSVGYLLISLALFWFLRGTTLRTLARIECAFFGYSIALIGAYVFLACAMDLLAYLQANGPTKEMAILAADLGVEEDAYGTWCRSWMTDRMTIGITFLIIGIQSVLLTFRHGEDQKGDDFTIANDETQDH